MVATRKSRGRAAVEEDPDRVIAVVTGANSGYGLGICQQLLTNLSLPSGYPMPASMPQATSLPPSLQHLLSSSCEAAVSASKAAQPNTTLTLILACRSEAKANIAREALLKRHKKELEKRKKQGVPEKEGWWDGLRIVWEGVNLDSVGGENGVLAFCQRLIDRYPHITSLFLNAGMAAFTGLSYWLFFKQIALEGMPLAMSKPAYNIETRGARSADGERGLVWGTNVLAPYIMIRELVPLLRRSPPSLPVAPRVVYTSSGTAAYYKLNQPYPLEDYQLLDYHDTYGASKYVADLVMLELDREYGSEPTGAAKTGEERSVRVMTVDPGCVATNIFGAAYGSLVWLAKIKWMCNWLAFYFCRLIGSAWHPVYADQGALPMIYAAFVSTTYLLPASQVPAPKYAVISTRWGKTMVGYGEVDSWEKADAEGLPKGMVDRCEVVRKEWRRREGLE
ncbi:hypothetical protein IAT38_005104 [Cryptococcus sp. DSM 104549]